MLLKVLEEEKPTHLLVAFDAGKSTFRHKTYAEYKGTRQKTPSELSGQIPMIHKLLDAFSIKRYEAKEYEADDIIGTQAVEAAKEGFEVVVITGDKDLLQLVDDHIEVVLTRKGITEVDRYNEAKIEERYGLTPKQIIDLKGLMGDTSDNIPGVPGVGEKTAIKLLTQFSDVETVLDSINEVSGKKLKERLEENKEQAILSKQLATIMTEVPLETALNDLAYNGFDYQAVKELFKAYAFNSLLNRIGGNEDQKEEALEEVPFEVVSEIKEDHLVSPSALVIEMLGDNYHHADIIGVGLANKNGSYFIPTKVAVESDLFQTFMADQKKEKYLFDAKRAVVALAWQDIELHGVAFDLQMASYLLDPSLSSHEMSDIASRKGSVRVLEDETVYGKGQSKQFLMSSSLLRIYLEKLMRCMY
ncbi:DNA polymerase I [Bacillus sp. JCM 19047]|nr:DNA polymerase I [Bacillus sp. JCM 19047]